jgi:hypothetical protein
MVFAPCFIDFTHTFLSYTSISIGERKKGVRLIFYIKKATLSCFIPFIIYMYMNKKLTGGF